MVSPSTRIRLAIVANRDVFFLSHRLPIALEALRRGWEVYLLAPDTGRRAEVEAYGINFVDVPISRSGSNPFYEARSVVALAKAYRSIRPDIVHHVGLKAILLGGLACRLFKVKHVVNAVSGFGYVFTGDGRRILRQVVSKVLRWVCGQGNESYIVQNPDDAAQVLAIGLCKKERITLIKGSGVDLKHFAYTPEPPESMVRILLPCRMLYDKGVMEFLGAAQSLRERLEGKALFVLAGDCDSGNKTVVPREELQRHEIPGYIEYIGFCKDIYSELQRSHIVVLPSYREGMPKSLIDAASVGRPLITTDAIGCRECVDDGVNGYLVPVRSVEALAEAISRLALSVELRQRFGLASRRKAEKEFSIEHVLDKTFALYEAGV